MEEQKLLTEFKKDSGRGLPARKVIAQVCKDAVSTTEIQLELELARDMQDNKKKASATRRASVTALLVRWCKQRLRTNNIYSFLLTSEAHRLIIEDNQIARACFVLGESSQLLILHMLGNGFWRIFPSNWGWAAQLLFPPGTTIQQRGEPGDKRFLKGPDCLSSLSLLLRSVLRPSRSLCLFSRAWQSELLFLIAEEDWVRVQLYKPDTHVTGTRWGAPKLRGRQPMSWWDCSLWLLKGCSNCGMLLMPGKKAPIYKNGKREEIQAGQPNLSTLGILSGSHFQACQGKEGDW